MRHGLRFELTSIDGQSTLQIGFTTQLEFFVRQHLIPMLRRVDGLRGISNQDEALWRDAAAVIGHTKGLAIRLLGLLDGHTHGNADVDMELLTGRIFQMEQHILPKTFLSVELAYLNNSRRYDAGIIDVDAGLKEERFGIHLCLAAVVVLEPVVM